MLKYLRTIAIAEGTSFILFGITMPLKYQFDILMPNKIVGWMHGLLFILYIVAMIYAARRYNWPIKTILIALAASLIPFAPFYVERRLLTAEAAKS